MFVANFWFLSETVYMATPQSQEPLLHLWSLAVEEQFYLLFPLILLGLSKVGRRLTWVLLAMLAILSLAYSQYLTGGDPNAAFFRPDTRAWQLLIGTLCALVPVLPTRVQSPLGLVGLVLVVASYFVLPAPVAPTAASLPI